MLKDEKPYIEHDGQEHRCFQAGYFNPVQHKWTFVIDGVNSKIRHGEKIKFMGIEFTVTFTERREATGITNCINNTSGTETGIQAWII